MAISAYILLHSSKLLFPVSSGGISILAGSEIGCFNIHRHDVAACVVSDCALFVEKLSISLLVVVSQ
jgi:hypothetical protein